MRSATSGADSKGATAGPSIVSGSHIDSQKPGGRYDGTLGALAALDRAAHAQGAVRPAEADARSPGVLRRGSEPLCLRPVLGLARHHRRHLAGRPRTDTGLCRREHRRRDARHRSRPGAHPRGEARRLRHLYRAPHRARADSRASRLPGRRRAGDHRYSPLCRRAEGHRQPRRGFPDGPAPRPDGGRRGDHVWRAQHRLSHGPSGGDDLRPDRGRPEWPGDRARRR